MNYIAPKERAPQGINYHHQNHAPPRAAILARRSLLGKWSGMFLQRLKTLAIARIWSPAKRPLRPLKWIGPAWRGYTHNARWGVVSTGGGVTDPSNPLRSYFQSVEDGPGIWKWDHYFDIYHRHFEKFRGKEVNVLEIGIYSGGSLGMWKAYFGPRCRVYGVDIEPDCRVYESDSVKVFIGDQGDRKFWRQFKREVPKIDIVIDDGGHQPRQQIVTLEEMLPHLRPGGVYVCEDVHGADNEFLFYVDGFSHNLHSFLYTPNLEDNRRRLSSKSTEFQSIIQSVHVYPFVTVIEKREGPLAEFVAPKRGTQWQPFLG